MEFGDLLMVNDQIPQQNHAFVGGRKHCLPVQLERAVLILDLWVPPQLLPLEQGASSDLF